MYGKVFFSSIQNWKQIENIPIIKETVGQNIWHTLENNLPILSTSKMGVSMKSSEI